MIIQPDFLDHWKTLLLIDLLGDQCAPLYVIRLWAHCQNRKTHRFPRANPLMAKAICKAPHDALEFEAAMVDSGFLKIEDGEIVAHEWDVVNSYLINSWENGKKGGRPRKKTQPKPTGNPRGNPNVTHAKPIREEKSRLDKIGKEEVADYPTLLKNLEEDQTIENAILAIYASHAAFAAVSRQHLETSLQVQPDRKVWPEAISGLSAAYAGAELPRPNRTLRNWLAGKVGDKQKSVPARHDTKTKGRAHPATIWRDFVAPEVSEDAFEKLYDISMQDFADTVRIDLSDKHDGAFGKLYMVRAQDAREKLAEAGY